MDTNVAQARCHTCDGPYVQSALCKVGLAGGVRKLKNGSVSEQYMDRVTADGMQSKINMDVPTRLEVLEQGPAPHCDAN